MEEFMYGIQYAAELRYILYHLINAFPEVTRSSVMKEETKAVIASGKIPGKNWLGLSEVTHLTVSRVKHQHEESLHAWKEDLLHTLQSVKMPVSPLDVLLNEDRRMPTAEVSERRIRIKKHHAEIGNKTTQEHGDSPSSSERSGYHNKDYYYIEKRGDTPEDLDRVNQMEWDTFKTGKKRVLLLSETSRFLLPQLEVPEDVALSYPVNGRSSLTLFLLHPTRIQRLRRCMLSGYARVVRLVQSTFWQPIQYRISTDVLCMMS